MPVPGNVAAQTSREAQIQRAYEQILAAPNGTQGIANGWLIYANQHPSESVATALQGYGATLAAEGIVNALGAATGAAAAAVGQAGAGTSSGLSKVADALASPLDFLKLFTERSLWLRVVKVVAGVALIITGVVQLTHAQNIAAAAIKTGVVA